MTEKRFNYEYFDVYEKGFFLDNGKRMLKDEVLNTLNELHEENEHYKAVFFEIVEAALTDKNCRELYCKGILDIFDKANSLNQARDMIKEHLE
jgi:hypothetical protein